jgi:hypothetical protein
MALTLGAGPALAGEREDLEALRQTTLDLIQALVQQGVLPADKAEQILRQARVKTADTVAAQSPVPAAQPAKEAGVVRVTYIPESLKKQITQQVREEVVAQAKAERWGDENAVPEWVDRIKIEGDMRVGYQGDTFGSANAPEIFFQSSGQNITNTTENRNRMRARARLALTAKVTPDLSAGLRLSTGSLSDAVSTSQTLGTYGNKYNFGLDRAFLKYHADDVLPWLTVTGGKLPNPFFSTDLVWNDNQHFEGVAVSLDPAAQTGNVIRPFAIVGAFPLQDVERSNSVKASSKWLYGTQLGLEWVPDNKKRAKLGLAYYDYQNVAGQSNLLAGDTAFDRTATDFRQKGNTLFNIAEPTSNTAIWGLAADYSVVNLTAMLDMTVSDPLHVIVSADMVENVGFNRAKTLARSGLDIDPQTHGYLARVSVGMPSMLLRGDWQLSLAYRHLEADAVLDAFTDGDFHLGGTNNKGYILGAQYGLGKNSWLSARWLSSNEITGLPLAVNVFQLYLNAKF